MSDWPPVIIHANAYGDWQSVSKKAEDPIGFKTYPYIKCGELREFIEGVVGYWTTSNDCLPSQEDAERLLAMITGEKQ